LTRKLEKVGLGLGIKTLVPEVGVPAGASLVNLQFQSYTVARSFTHNKRVRKFIV